MTVATAYSDPATAPTMVARSQVDERATAPSAQQSGPVRSGSARRLSSTVLTVFVAVTLAVTAYIRIRVGASEPIWLDEAWTGVHALQPTLSQFFREIYVDINAPLYYFLMWCWAAWFGVSNEAMRFPSLVFGLLAPLIALLPSREIDRRTRLIWCALIAAWEPGLFQSQEARGYTLLLALSTGGVLLHARLMATPTLARASAWASVGALAILTHYYAAVLFGCQGLAYLARHRNRAFRTWPAALIFVPAFGWMAYHLPQLAAYSSNTWYSTVSVSWLPFLAWYAVGPGALTIPLMSPGVPGCFLGVPLPSRLRGTETVMPWVIGAVVVGTAILVVAGCLRPSFTPRYLTIFVPGLLLALSAWTSSIGRTRAWAPLVLIAASLSAVVFWAVNLRAGSSRPLNFETASEYLMQEGADVVRFTWDNPSTKGLTPGMMAEFGSFFFRRAGSAIQTEGVVLEKGEDPNVALLAGAQAGKPGIIWIYDLAVPGTIAKDYPPAITTRDPNWTCRDFGQDPLSVLACIRSGSKQPPS